MFTAKIILLDIEGTTTSISFVKDILFPYAKEHTEPFLDDTYNDEETKKLIEDLISLPEHKDFLLLHPEAKDSCTTAKSVARFVNYLIDRDLKLGPLKTLQGLVWSRGYADGSLKGHVYKDVPRAFERWRDNGIRIAIYSSGSIKAQQLLFGQTNYGNLLPFISGHFDTTSGHKREQMSYENIAKSLATQQGDIIFLTDILEEAIAAQAAGMQTVLLDRPGNAPLPPQVPFQIFQDFNSIDIRAS